MTDTHGDFGYAKGSTWHRIMTSGTPAEKKALDKWLSEAKADERSMMLWARDGAMPGYDTNERESVDESVSREVLTPDVDAFLKKRGYNPEGSDDE